LSRAFVKEQDGAEVDTDLPELVVSPHRNLVTPEGLAHIGDRLHRAREAVIEARAAGDRAGIARHSRDLRYWERRRASAEVVPHAAGSDIVRHARFASSAKTKRRPPPGGFLTYRRWLRR